MKESEKEEYVKQWNNYIGGLNSLAFNPSDELSAKITKHIKDLQLLTAKVADAKIQQTQKNKNLKAVA